MKIINFKKEEFGVDCNKISFDIELNNNKYHTSIYEHTDTGKYDMQTWLDDITLYAETGYNYTELMLNLGKSIYAYENEHKIRCCRCGELTKLNLKNQYYAGIYCDKCWNNHIKYYAENENYD